MERVIFEVCLDSVEGVRIAADAGADRVELCANLVAGGTTPSLGTIELARAASTSIGLCVLVRPRGGDFLYSADEFRVICRDVERVREAGADLVAIGVLCADGTIDVPRTQALIDRARPMQVTFHRAFDMTRDPIEALETLLELSVDRILTSGQKASAFDGRDCIRALVDRAGDRLVILPGGGIRPHNVGEILTSTGASEVHATAGEVVDGGMAFRAEDCSLSGARALGEFELSQTAPTRIEAMVAELTAFRSPQ